MTVAILLIAMSLVFSSSAFAQGLRRPEVDENEPEASPTPRAERAVSQPTPALIPLEPPAGFAGRAPREIPAEPAVPIQDRWRIGSPDYQRYPGQAGEYPYTRGHWWDPYNQNLLKGDYPVVGQHTFMSLSLISDTLIEGRRVPVPSNVSSSSPGSYTFFGRGDQLFIDQNFPVSIEVFHGDAGFKPRDWELRVTPVFNVNYLDAAENGLVNIDVRDGTTRTDTHVGFQELFGDLHLADVSPDYDFVSLRAGIQGFTSDFRGFIFSDSEPGVRLFGNLESNRDQWNLAYFYNLEKDTNSGLNTIFNRRDQQIVVANAFRQDCFWDGYTSELSALWDHDEASFHLDTNGFLARPAPIGIFQPHEINAVYLGWLGDGHIGWLNVTHAFYQVVGRDDRNPLAGRGVDLNAQMAALELSVDRDWLRFKGSFLWASGDGDPRDGTARGFDAVMTNPTFAGGGFSFWDRQSIPLTGTGVQLVNRLSPFPSLRTSEIEGQANFVNPGVFLYNLGVEARLTPKLRAEMNLNYLQFEHTQPLQLILFQSTIGHQIGWDPNVGIQYRPLLTDNVIFTAGAAALLPGNGLNQIYTAQALYSVFGALTLTY
ncbi:MAG: hypothetical protein HYR72_05645 [Deltaproteobacteria bacterium]|nr:hypothetical protein [Deltaproteobacteria bacterium]MBI3389627.1 hypothetical protein [Deltaproteobacteria bacterium]